MCCYLNLQFRGQRVKEQISGKNKHSKTKKKCVGQAVSKRGMPYSVFSGKVRKRNPMFLHFLLHIYNTKIFIPYFPLYNSYFLL